MCVCVGQGGGEGTEQENKEEEPKNFVISTKESKGITQA